MGVLEELLKEIKLLNKNLSAIRVEMSTVDTSTVQNVVKEAPSENHKLKNLKGRNT